MTAAATIKLRCHRHLCLMLFHFRHDFDAIMATAAVIITSTMTIEVCCT